MIQVFCLDGSNIPDYFFKEKPITGQLYNVKKVYKNAYVLHGVYNESQFVGGKWREPSFDKNRFVAFDNIYDVDEFNSLQTPNDVDIFYAIDDINKGLLSDSDFHDDLFAD